MSNNTNEWFCAAIDHGVSIYSNGKIGPCCQIKADYLKPASEITNPDRFADLRGIHSPPACDTCNRLEHAGLHSYRHTVNGMYDNTKEGIQFLDIRNTNFCNLQCRYCGPLFSDKWAKDHGYDNPIQVTNINEYYKYFTDDLVEIYFTGGEPMINEDHWTLLEYLIDNNLSENIMLRYNTNMTTIIYKNKNIRTIWENFKSVRVMCSIDAAGEINNHIRSGSQWGKIKENILELNKFSNNVTLYLSPVISILNIWDIDDLYQFAVDNNLEVHPIMLRDPLELTLSVCPPSLRTLALEKIENLTKYNIDKNVLTMFKTAMSEDNSYMFDKTLLHILYLDKHKNEKLIDFLPFKDQANKLILLNQMD